jgi:hypothetical protein
MKSVSLAPKYTIYNPDGAGRDMYITYNNGGFLKKGIRIYGTGQNYTKRPPLSTTHIGAYKNINF